MDFRLSEIQILNFSNWSKLWAIVVWDPRGFWLLITIPTCRLTIGEQLLLSIEALNLYGTGRKRSLKMQCSVWKIRLKIKIQSC